VPWIGELRDRIRPALLELTAEMRLGPLGADRWPCTKSLGGNGRRDEQLDFGARDEPKSTATN
jgi:hypothetical protein